MREVKFRAWDREDKRMFIPEYLANPTGVNFTDIMQYTGLKDKNGKEIYEGDIIAFTNKNIFHFPERNGNLSKPETGIWIEKEEGINKTPAFTEKVIYGRKCLIVKWQEDLTGYYPFADSPDNCGHCGGGYSSKSFEVFGNIYENPNLIPSPSKQ